MRGSVELIYSSAEGGYTNASTSIKRQGRRGRRRRPEVILERTRMEEREKRKESGSKIDKGKGG